MNRQPAPRTLSLPPGLPTHLKILGFILRYFPEACKDLLLFFDSNKPYRLKVSADNEKILPGVQPRIHPNDGWWESDEP
jgi:hypothetical protein